jgi:hypothetical protein
MPSRDYPAVHGPPPDNAEIARQLDAFASLLELAGAGPYTARAYRRASDLIRSTPAPVSELGRGRRGGATAEDVFNTRPLDEVLARRVGRP